jgi:hypothetical protein
VCACVCVCVRGNGKIMLEIHTVEIHGHKQY